MKQLFVSALLGILCCAVMYWLAKVGSENQAWVGWLVSLALAGFAIGFWWPRSVLLGILALVAIQPLCLLIVALESGEVANPSRSTGGLVGVFIGSMFMLLATPVPALASWLGSWVGWQRRRMNTWKPATRVEVESLLADSMRSLHSSHREGLERNLVPLRAIPVDEHPGEHVFVVAECDGKVLYYSDIEGGWELDTPTASGGIRERGSNQFDLVHITTQLFGEPGD